MQLIRDQIHLKRWRNYKRKTILASQGTRKRNRAMFKELEKKAKKAKKEAEKAKAMEASGCVGETYSPTFLGGRLDENVIPQ